MFNRIVLVLAMALVGCGPDPLPETIAVAGAREWQIQVLTDVLDHYCAATGWCPEIVESESGNALFTDQYPLVKRNENKPAYHQHGIVRFDLAHWQINDFDWLWHIGAHEFGHHGSKKHSKAPGSILHYTADAPAPACLDQATVDQFCNASQQCTKQVSTCQP
jgi:hypothetical protein